MSLWEISSESLLPFVWETDEITTKNFIIIILLINKFPNFIHPTTRNVFICFFLNIRTRSGYRIHPSDGNQKEQIYLRLWIEIIHRERRLMFIEKFRHLHFSTSFHIQLPDFECSASIFNAISPSNHIQYQHKHDGVRKSYKKVYSHLIYRKQVAKSRDNNRNWDNCKLARERARRDRLLNCRTRLKLLRHREYEVWETTE